MPNHAHATLVGHVGGEVQFREAGKNNVASFSLAVNTGWGEKKVTTWWRVSVWGKPAEWARDQLAKGSAVMVSGEPAERTFVHNGEERKTLEISCREFIEMGKRSTDAPSGGHGQPDATPTAESNDVPF